MWKMKMDSEKKIYQLIQDITNDEDHRQELYLYYLSTNSEESIDIRLSQIEKRHNIEDKIQIDDKTLMNIANMDYIVDNFSDIENMVLCMIMLGMSVDDMALYMSVNINKINSIILSIKNNDIWTNLRKNI